MDNPFDIPTSGQGDWDASLDGNFLALERGYHVTEMVGTVVGTGTLLTLNSSGFFMPTQPNSSQFAHAMTYTAAASGETLTALAWGIQRSLSLTPAAAGSLLYGSITTPGLIVTSPNGAPVGVGLTNHGILFNPTHVTTVGGGGGGGGGSLAGLSDVNTTGVANGKVLTWVDAASKWEPATPSGGGSSFDLNAPPAASIFSTIINGASVSPSPSITDQSYGCLWDSGPSHASTGLTGALTNISSSTIFDVKMGVHINMAFVDFRSVGIAVTDGTKYWGIRHESDKLHTFRYFASNSFNNVPESIQPFSFRDIYFRITGDGTNLNALWSMDGRNWISLYSEGITSFMGSLTKVGIISDANANAIIPAPGSDHAWGTIFYWSMT